jgi:hypothetical protein
MIEDLILSVCSHAQGTVYNYSAQVCRLKINRHGYEPAWIMRALKTKCQLENKQL